MFNVLYRTTDANKELSFLRAWNATFIYFSQTLIEKVAN